MVDQGTAFWLKGSRLQMQFRQCQPLGIRGKKRPDSRYSQGIFRENICRDFPGVSDQVEVIYDQSEKLCQPAQCKFRVPVKVLRLLMQPVVEGHVDDKPAVRGKEACPFPERMMRPDQNRLRHH